MRRGLLHLRSPHLCLDAMNIPEIDTTAMEPTRGSERKGMRLVGLLALVTLVFFGLGGAWLIVGVQGRELAPVLVGPSGLWWQIFLGIASGLAIGYSAWALISRPFMETVLMKYAMLIGPLMPGATARILVSLCAGVGEEVFFRGAIQHWLGIVWTALAFVALHGYLDPRSWRMSVYGVFLTITMLGLGWEADAYGLLAPMIAHTLIDIVLLGKLHAVWRRSRQRV